ncbi:hypothetical protein JOC95_002107 [Bacillus tianshenii]|uniref:Uncharacterized protein n=1 Tax=Sutcliffiella tianshenii TaxID=1463404 RepID=A0ABS2P060_9BACI|nr:hypothetical protein [Bacillus tianshenii]
MKVTNEARDVLVDILRQNGAKNIRVYFAGWG